MKLITTKVLLLVIVCLSLSVAEGSGDLGVSGTTTTSALTVSGLNCTANTNGGALTADASGVVSCSDDDGGGNTLDTAYDQGGAGAGGTITADAGAVIIEGTGGLVLDGNNLDQLPRDPVLTGSLANGEYPYSVYVSGRYAYVVSAKSRDLKVIDVSDPSAPSLAGSLGLGLGANPSSVYVSGRYAYVVDSNSDDLKVIDISGAEVTSLIAHSLEAGNLQVRNDMLAQGQLQVSGGLNVGTGGIFSDGNVGISGTIAIANDIAPTASPANLVQLFAEDVAASSELKVRDEAGNITTLSPHNFSLIGTPSEPMAWSFYSENEHGKINVDMLRMVRLVEEMSGQKLVHTEADGNRVRAASGNVGAGLPELVGSDSRGYTFVHYQKLVAPLIEAVQELKGENDMRQAEYKARERRLESLERRLN